MIEAIIYQSKNKLLSGFMVKGHAGYGTEGQDIICASVSILVINTVNSIETFTSDRFEVKTGEEEGMIYFRILSEVSPESCLLLHSMVLGLDGIEAEYGKQYIKLIRKEV